MEQPLIVIVNADRSFLEMMSELLGEEGYHVLIAQERDDAFEIIKNRMPGLVILELLVTDPEHGLMVLNKMHLHPQTTTIPVIIASAGTQLIRDNESHLRDKRCEILMKPFDLEDLLTMVSKFVQPSA